MGTTTRRRAADPDTATCKAEGCSDPRSEHSLDGKTCFANKGKDDDAPLFTCPCRGFAHTEEAAAYLRDGEPTNAEMLPETGPVIASDIPVKDNGELDKRALNRAIASSPEPSESSE